MQGLPELKCAPARRIVKIVTSFSSDRAQLRGRPDRQRRRRMSLRGKLESFLRLSGAERRLVGEAVVWLGLARLVLATIPFRILARELARVPESGTDDVSSVLRVRRAVKTAARHVPWKAVCLPQAIAAKIMLARRGCGSALHLGAGFDGSGALIAHAWLVVGGTVVMGGAGMSGVTPLTRLG